MNGRIALVTGGSRGIGAATVRALAARGATVIVAARGLEASERLVTELRFAGHSALAVTLDVSSAEGIATGLAEAAEAVDGAPIDVLVNNAGIAESAPFHTGEKLTRRLLEINFHGARRLIEALAPAMIAAGGGAVVNVASSAGLRGYAYVSAYCASKFALVGYSLALADELAPKHVRVNVVCPHYVETSMLERSIENVIAKTGRTQAEARATFEAMNPGGRLVQPTEVADAVVELVDGERSGLVVELGGGQPRFHTPNAPDPRADA
ncbi:MAG: SDR family NAD(P)-dependent oxidoreductase [Planctomycetota bacterium]